LTSDLVAFCAPGVRAKLPADKGVTYVECPPASSADKNWDHYKFINSVYYLTTPQAAEALKDYEYVLRTDNDVFLTKNFKGLEPRLPMFGVGGYVRSREVSEKLMQVAERLKLNYCYIHNVGSTIFYRKDSVLRFSQHQFNLCHWLFYEEFAKNPGVWPGWCRGVITMYAGELAANDLFDYGITLGGFDCMSMSDDKIGSTDYHIHAFHTDQYFSKLAWREGKYKDMDPDKLDLTKINDYCLSIALSTE
jgi:hypothetical protein